MADSEVLSFEGSNYLRQRLILATLSRRTIKIKKIRIKDDDPGLKEYEASLVRLMDKLTNGSVIEINQTGTGLYYQPGILFGGELEHNCSLQRSIGYYLEVIVALAPFCKHNVKIKLTGITATQLDPSVDSIKYSSLPVLKRFIGDDDRIECTISKRGAAPDGGGIVHFTCPVKPKLRPLQYLNPGKIKRVRGVAWACLTSPVTANRMVDSVRSILNKYLSDVYIYSDHSGPTRSGKSAGFGVTLWAETMNGSVYFSESCSHAKSKGKQKTTPIVPEDVGKEAVEQLLEEISRGGCIDSTNQSLAFLFMSLGETDVSKLQIGPLTPYSIEFLRHLKMFFQVVFKLEPLKDTEGLRTGTDKIIVSCMGAGFTNLNKNLT